MRCFVRKRKRGWRRFLEEYRKVVGMRQGERERARPSVDNKRASVPAPAPQGWGGLTGKALAQARPSTQHQNRLHIDCSWQRSTNCSSSQSPQRSEFNNQLYKHPVSLSKVGRKEVLHTQVQRCGCSSQHFNVRHTHTNTQIHTWDQSPAAFLDLQHETST